MKQSIFIVSLLMAALLAFACSKEDPVTSELTQGEKVASLAKSGRGKPVVDRQELNFSFVGPPGFFCNDFTVKADLVGQAVTQVWTFGDETIFKEEVNVFVTFTNVATGAAVTNHQTNTAEFLVHGGEIIKSTDSGGLMRVVIPGQGLVVQFVGHSVVTFDYSVFPPLITVDFNGRAFGDICDLID